MFDSFVHSPTSSLGSRSRSRSRFASLRYAQLGTASLALLASALPRASSQPPLSSCLASLLSQARHPSSIFNKINNNKRD